MASSEKTTNLQLNKWTGSDRSQREDFNYDNKQIDGWAGQVNTQLNAYAKDSGWINLLLEEGVMAEVTPRYRKIGKFIIIEGSIKGINNLETFKNIAILPSGFIPSSSIYIKAPIKNTPYNVNLAVGSAGNIAISYADRTITSDLEIALNIIFTID